LRPIDVGDPLRLRERFGGDPPATLAAALSDEVLIFMLTVAALEALKWIKTQL
jgi:hypothetical protein